ncbi:hypothetical protein ACI2KR_06440 [Pseudomonas luteola]
MPEITVTNEMVEAGFDSLEPRGFRLAGYELGAEDLKIVFKSMLAASPTLGTPLEDHPVVEMLLAVAKSAWEALEDTGETDNGLVWDQQSFLRLSEAMDRLEALPDDNPGFEMEPAAKARWALRNILVK